MSYSTSSPANYSSATVTNSPELKLYQAFIFSVPICFTFVVLLLFYLVYLRRSSADLSSLGMRSGFVVGNTLSIAELGLSKELREMLPIVVFRESFSVMDLQCSVCLGDYQADDKLQHIPACGHTFHMDCIDLWLTSHTTCPLCRLTLLPSQSHQSQEDSVPSVSTPEVGGSSQPESSPVNHGIDGQEDHVPSVSTPEVKASSQPECNPVNQENDGQEQQRELNESNRDGEGVKETETQEDEQNSIGTSNACCNCKLS